MELQELEIVRRRWRRWREVEKLVEPDSNDFAQGGLARLIADQTSRFVILPADPEAHIIDFDEELWAWWREEFEDPSTGVERRWGQSFAPTTEAAVIGSEVQDAQWSRYVALYRSGGLEVGLGADGSFLHDETRYFYLAPIVARCWAAIARFSGAIERFALVSPFELTLSLAVDEASSLARFAEGWAEPGSFEYPRRAPLLTGVLIRREVDAWPASAEEVRDLAFSIGAQIEDSWGCTQRRFLAHRGEFQGQFDPRTAAW